MLDVLNEQLNAAGEEPIAFDSDCREGICGMCGLMISGKAHGPEVTTTCQLHMRSFTDGDESSPSSRGAPTPSRSSRTSSSTAAPSTGSSRPAASSASTPARPPRPTRCRCPSRTPTAPSWRPSASAAAPASRPAPTRQAMLFMGAKITHLGELPQGQPERTPASSAWSNQHDARGLRRLHQHRRVLAGLPEGDPAWTSSTSSTRTCATPSCTASDTRARPGRTRHRRPAPEPPGRVSLSRR